jgi:hypothetical protein
MTRPAVSRSLIRAHTLTDSEPLMTPESTGGARAALAAFPGIADVAVLARRIGAAPGIGVSMAGLFKAATAGDTDRQLDQMAARGNNRQKEWRT